jgi:hypothetical protein
LEKYAGNTKLEPVSSMKKGKDTLYPCHGKLGIALLNI